MPRGHLRFNLLISKGFDGRADVKKMGVGRELTASGKNDRKWHKNTTIPNYDDQFASKIR